MGNNNSIEDKTSKLDKGQRHMDSRKTITVPSGHTVVVHKLSPFSHVERLAGGMLVAHLGIAGLSQCDEIEYVFEQVRAHLLEQQGHQSTLLLMPSETSKLSDIFAPHDPWTGALSSGVVWTVSTGGLDHFLQNPARIEQLLDHFQAITKLGCCRQWLYITPSQLNASSIHNEDILIQLLRNCNVECRYPDKSNGSCLLEVTRPEGVVITALAGEPVPDAAGSSSIDHASRQQLMDRVRIYTIPPLHQHKPAPRDGTLRRLMLAVGEAEKNGKGAEWDSAWDGVYKYLLGRRRPLLLMSTRDGQVSPMEWPGIGRAIPVFVDLLSFQFAMADYAKQGAQFGGCAEMSVEQLSQWLLKIQVPPVLNVFKSRSEPMYLQPGLGALVGLAQGRVPTTSERGNKNRVA